MPPLGVNKVPLQVGVQYVVVLTGYSTPNGVDTNRQFADDNGDLWLDNRTYTLVRNRESAAVLPLGVKFPCVLSKASNKSFYAGALHQNRLIVRRVDFKFKNEALFVVPHTLKAPNIIYAVLQWQAYSDVDPDYMFPENFDYIMTVPKNDVDKRIEEWFAMERKYRLAQQDTQSKAQLQAQKDAELAARRARSARERSMEFKKGEEYDLMLLKATKYHREQVSDEATATLAVLEPNVIYPAQVLRNTTLWETDKHPQLWLHVKPPVAGKYQEYQDQALCVQIRTRDSNLLQFNQNTGRKVLIGDLVWHTHLGNYNGEYPVIDFKPSPDMFHMHADADALFGQANFLQLRF